MRPDLGIAASKPEIILACGDGNACLAKTCAGGIVETFKAEITLGGLVLAPGETDVCSEMTLTFSQGGPGMMDSGIYELSNSRR